MKKHIDVLLINPPIASPHEHSFYSKMSPPLGLCYLGSMLSKSGYKVKVIDMVVEDDPLNELINTLQADKPDIVGITLTTQGYYTGMKIAQIVKQYLESAKIITGGSHATYEYAEVLKNNIVDVVNLYEGEETIIELANYYIKGEGTLDSIRGIAYKDNGKVIMTQSRPLIVDLDGIPIPDRSLIKLEKYPRKGTIITSRGCVKKCIFCVAGNYEGNYRPRSPENVIAELEIMYKDYGIRSYYFFDNVFTVDFDRVEKICSFICNSNMKIDFYCVARLDTVCNELMSVLRSAGCYRVEIGVESASQDIIDHLEKGISVASVLKVADIALKHNIQPMFTFQVGHPFDTLESMTKTIGLIKELRLKGAGAYLSIMTPYPGTPVYENRSKYGINIEANNWEDYRMTNPICSTANFSLNDLRKLIFMEYKAM
jgi:anaerobic magnesium-protoporphyrin IX monomethyl ester cyclase